MTGTGTTIIDGFVKDDRFEPMRERLAQSIADGDDLGGSVAVSLDGEMVVDLWGGSIDDAGSPWQQDTIINVWSTTKTMAFLCTLMLIDRGQVDPDAPVATYWPEFAANGKEGVLVRHLFSHSSGLSSWTKPFSIEELYDWDRATSALAAQAPLWTPGTRPGYHAVNQGHLLGEVIRRVDGRSPDVFFAEEVAGPLGADFHIGLTDESVRNRVAPILPPTDPLVSVDAPDPETAAIVKQVRKTFAPLIGAGQANTAEWQNAVIPAANGHGNARSVVRCQSAMANGGAFDGVRLLGADTIERVFEEQVHGYDVMLDGVKRYGLGYALKSEAYPTLPDGRVGYWGGWGGSSIIIDADRHLTFSFVMNRMKDPPADAPQDMRAFRLAQLAFAAIGA